MFFSPFSSSGLVRLYIAGLPLRSCQTIGAPSVQGSAQCPMQQQDSKPRPVDNHVDVLPLRHLGHVLQDTWFCHVNQDVNIH